MLLDMDQLTLFMHNVAPAAICAMKDHYMRDDMVTLHLGRHELDMVLRDCILSVIASLVPMVNLQGLVHGSCLRQYHVALWGCQEDKLEPGHRLKIVSQVLFFILGAAVHDMCNFKCRLQPIGATKLSACHWRSHTTAELPTSCTWGHGLGGALATHCAVGASKCCRSAKWVHSLGCKSSYEQVCRTMHGCQCRRCQLPSQCCHRYRYLTVSGHQH